MLDSQHRGQLDAWLGSLRLRLVLVSAAPERDECVGRFKNKKTTKKKGPKMTNKAIGWPATSGQSFV